MKKYLFLAAASIALASCVNDEKMEMAPKAQKISFDMPVMGTQTKAEVAGEIYGSTYPETEKFVVYAKQHAGNLTTWAAAQSFWNTSNDNPITVSRKAAADWEEEGGKIYYWPKDDDNNIHLSFAAYSPAALGTTTPTVTYGGTGLTIDGFTVEGTVANQIDLMYSERILNQQQTTGTGVAVPVLFKHALSSIVFSAIESDDANVYNITSIKVDGKFATSGKFEEKVTDGPTYTASPKWTPQSSSATTTYQPTLAAAFAVPSSSAENFTGYNTASSTTSAILPIPQNVPAEATVTITYERTGTDGTKTYTVTKKLLDFKDSSSNNITEWVMGCRYNYQFQFGGTPKIFFSPSVTDWKDGGTVFIAI